MYKLLKYLQMKIYHPIFVDELHYYYWKGEGMRALSRGTEGWPPTLP